MHRMMEREIPSGEVELKQVFEEQSGKGVNMEKGILGRENRKDKRHGPGKIRTYSEPYEIIGVNLCFYTPNFIYFLCLIEV